MDGISGVFTLWRGSLGLEEEYMHRKQSKKKKVMSRGREDRKRGHGYRIVPGGGPRSLYRITVV